jgi:hypothetical protein
MKNLIFLFFLIIGATTGSAQIEFGVKAGLSSYNLADKPIEILDKNLQISIYDASYGHHAGIYTRVKLLGIFVEPALLFNSHKVTYKLGQYGEAGILDELKTERYNYVDIPVMVGYKLGPVRFQIGAVSHIFINSISDLITLDGYEQKFKDATYGYQAGLGLDIGNVRLDVNYEGNLTAFGDHFTIDGDAYSFGNRPNRLVASVGYKF